MIKVAGILTSNKERDSLKRVQLLVDQDPHVVNTLNWDVHLFILLSEEKERKLNPSET